MANWMWSTCINTIGSYQCECSEGHYHQNNWEQCQDIDECLTEVEPTEPDFCQGGTCSNHPGGYECICPENTFLMIDNGPNNVPFCGKFSKYRVEEDNGCSISPINDTSVIYETPNPYTNDARCKAEFNCPDDQIIRYFIERFDIEKEDYCDYDSLVINDQKYCNGNEPSSSGILESRIVEFSSDASYTREGFKMEIHCS